MLTLHKLKSYENFWSVKHALVYSNWFFPYMLIWMELLCKTRIGIKTMVQWFYIFTINKSQNKLKQKQYRTVLTLLSQHLKLRKKNNKKIASHHVTVTEDQINDIFITPFVGINASICLWKGLTHFVHVSPVFHFCKNGTKACQIETTD